MLTFYMRVFFSFFFTPPYRRHGMNPAISIHTITIVIIIYMCKYISIITSVWPYPLVYERQRQGGTQQLHQASRDGTPSTFPVRTSKVRKTRTRTRRGAGGGEGRRKKY